MNKVEKPNKLKKGSRIAIVSPSWGGAFHYPKVLDRAILNLQNIFGFEIIEFSTARMDSKTLFENPKYRADDINNAFNDHSIDAIFISIGGTDSIQILEFLDVEIIKNNPKIILGFSDSITILSYLNYLGLVTFHGPSMMAGWAQIHNFPILHHYYKNALMNNSEFERIEQFPFFCEGYPDWSNNETIGHINALHKSGDLRWLQGNNVIIGKLWGGCIEVLYLLLQSNFWPDNSFWSNRILIIETSQVKPTPTQVENWLVEFGEKGILELIKGVLIGRSMGYTIDESLELDTIVLKISNRYNGNSIPIVSNLCFGHTDPNLILPYGINFKIDPIKKEINRVEKVYIN